MKHLFAPLLLLLIISPLPCRAGSQGGLPSANVLLDQGVEAYDHAKTIQATVTIRMPGEKNDTIITLEVQAQNRPDGMISREKLTTTTNARDSFDETVSNGHWTSLYDGQTQYTLYPSLKKYRADSGTDRFSNLFRHSILKYRSALGVETVSLARLHGKPVYLIQSRSRMGSSMHAVVSREDHTLILFSLSTPHGNASLRVTGLRLNAALSVSSWKPPADFEELKTSEGKPNAELPDFSRIAPKSPPAISSATAAEAQDWMQKMFDAQQRLTSYSALGEKTEEIQDEPGGPTRVTAEIRYKLPNLISLVTTAPSDSGKAHTVAVCDGQWFSAQKTSVGGIYMHIPAPKGRKAYDQACSIFVTEDNFFSPGLGLEMMMRGESPLAFLKQAASNFSLSPDSVVGDTPVKVVYIPLAVTASGEPLQSITYMIGRDDFLFRRLIWKEILPGNRTHLVIQTLSHIKPDGDIPASAFLYTPLPHARAVTTLD